MIDLFIAMLIGSPYATLETVKPSVEAILKNMGTDNYKFMISLSPTIDDEIIEYLHHLNIPGAGKIHIWHENLYWSEFTDKAMELSTNAEYLAFIHDDAQLLTPSFFPLVKQKLKDKTDIGWITFTDKDYIHGRFCPPTREGFYKDTMFEKALERRKAFQYHTLSERWWNTSYLWQVQSLSDDRRQIAIQHFANLPFDFPQQPVKCHAPYTHFFMIETEKLKQIGKCENWAVGTRPGGLLTDEDWGLRALQQGLWNVWIPDIKYLHIKTYPWQHDGSARSSHEIGQFKYGVEDKFFDKWHFHQPVQKEDLDVVKREYSGTNIPWSIDRYSYGWSYL